MINKKKKKGFTLIELIAVIAILAILGVILVPKIAGYTSKANVAKDLTNAKGLLQAVEMYNQESANVNTQIGTSAQKTAGTPYTLDTISEANLKAYVSWPIAPKTITGTISTSTLLVWEGMTYDHLKAYASELEAKQ